MQKTERGKRRILPHPSQVLNVCERIYTKQPQVYTPIANNAQKQWPCWANILLIWGKAKAQNQGSAEVAQH